MARKPTKLQRQLVEIYFSMRVPNKREAYEQAGYQARGETARVEAERTLQLPHVAAYLEELRAKSQKRAEKTADEIIAELEKIGFANIRNYISDENQIQDISQLPPEIAAAVESIQTTVTVTSNKDGSREYETKNTKFKLHDKRAALVDLGKRFGIFPNKTELTGKDGGPIEANVTLKDGKRSKS